DANAFELAISALAVINKSKADNEVSLGRGVEMLTLRANAATLGRLASVEGDVLAATRCLAHQSEEDSTLEDGEISIGEIVFAPKPQKPAK
ncbi:MAG: valine--tRNA ligase, partial [bacterium]|nr:valine--tRNA ligase [bacterium]